MGEALALRETGSQPVALTSDQLQFISRTEFVPKALRGNLPAILACVSTGREMGIGDMQALRSIHIIDGKPSFSAELMVARVRAAEHSITFKASADSCTVYGKRGDNGDTGEFEYTLEMAKRAGLLGKDNWKKYPEAMLWARAVSQLCRMLFADCLAGVSYTPEELGAGDLTADELMDEPVEDAQAGEESEFDGKIGELMTLGATLGVSDAVKNAIETHRDSPDFAAWLDVQISNARDKLAEAEAAA